MKYLFAVKSNLCCWMVLYMFKSSIATGKNVECHFPKSEQANDFQFTEKISQKL